MGASPATKKRPFMKLLGLIPEPPFAAHSWSGSSAHFFRALQRQKLLASAEQVCLRQVHEWWQKARTFSWPMSRWRATYHSSVPRFEAMSAAAQRITATHMNVDAIIQVGCWFSAAVRRGPPCYSYHDGNAAMWYQHYGHGLLPEKRVQLHLDWERRTYGEMNGIFVMSSWLADSFVADFGVQSDKIHVVGAGINFETLPAVPDRDFTAARFLMVGRDFERKGGRVLLEAFKIVRKELPDAELLVVGPDPQPAPPGVAFLGFLDKSNPAHRARLDQVFRSATAFVLPSIYEPFGIALAEAMAYGLPCAAVNRCAMPEIVQDGITGRIAEPENSRSLANAMLDLARSPSTAQSMGAKGRSRAEERFTWDRVAERIGEIVAA